MSVGVVIDLNAVGQVVEGRPYRVSSKEIAAFAEATNDDVSDCLAGRLAPPVYAINPVLHTMVAAKKKACESFGFHGEHDFQFLRSIVPGMLVDPRAEVIGIHQRSSGVTVTVRVLSTVLGELINEQHFVGFIPNGRVEQDVGKTAPHHTTASSNQAEAPDYIASSDLQPDQTRLYATASNDHDAYTTDEAVARSMGFPGLVVHGMLTVALSSGAVIKHACGGNPGKLRRLAVRLSRPLYLTPGQRVTTRLWRADAGLESALARYSFIAQNYDGETVLTNGVAEVSQ